MKVASVRAIQEIEAAADRSIMSYKQMMRNAGAASSAYLQRRQNIDADTTIVFLIGKGNNGGDGLVMAHALAHATEADVRLYLLEPRDLTDRHYQKILDDGLSVTLARADRDRQQLKDLIRSADIIVDAVFGIGARLPLQGEAANLLGMVNECLSQSTATRPETDALHPETTGMNACRSRPFILAIDCPSGIDCNTGELDKHTIAADATITFIAAKPGLFTFPAANCVGELVISAIGIPDSLPELNQVKTTVVDASFAASLLPARPLDGHKGTFGKVMIVAGSPRYIGAIALAAESAYRSGAGLVTVATGRKLTEIVAGSLREPTWLPLADVDGAISECACETVFEQFERYDVFLVGCGLGLHERTQAFVRCLLAGGGLPQLVLDADALNILSQESRWWENLPTGTIITPHPGEMARLTGWSARAINEDRWAIASKCAKSWNLVIVLKGAHTLIAAPDGRMSVIPFKTDALSTAGTGDILAGLIAGLYAQGLSAFDSARLGAYAHASAGIIAAETGGSSRSVIAGDVLPALGKAFAAIESL